MEWAPAVALAEPVEAPIPESLLRPAEDWLRYQSLERQLSPNSISAYRRDLAKYQRYLTDAGFTEYAELEITDLAANSIGPVDAARLRDFLDPRPAPLTRNSDGATATVPGVVCAVMTADCLPVLFADRAGKVVGAAHAGWKGAFSGIIESTLGTMEKLGADKNNIVASIGPGIGPGANTRFSSNTP